MKAKDFDRELEAVEAEIAGCKDAEFRRNARAVVLEMRKMYSFLKKLELTLPVKL